MISKTHMQQLEVEPDFNVNFLTKQKRRLTARARDPDSSKCQFRHNNFLLFNNWIFFKFQAESLVEEAVKKARVAHDVMWTLYHDLFSAKASAARTTKGEKASAF